MRLNMLGEGFPMDLDTDVVPSDAEEASFLDKVKEFKRKADDVFTVYKKLETQRDVAYSDPELRRSYDSVMGRADNIFGQVREYVPQIDSVLSWAGSLFGLNRQQTLGQLGIAQFLVLGIGALITIMTVWLTDAWTESKKLDAASKYIDQGLSATEAAKLARGEVGGFLTGVLGGGLGGGIALALIAGGAIFMLMRQGKR